MYIRKSIVTLFIFLLTMITLAGEFQIIDGKVVFPESDITSTATYYTVKEVEFFVARNSKGVVISHKNACQACGPVGFVQNGTAMKCNGCGLEYELDILGVDNPGSCWPFYVPNSIVEGNIKIALTDLGLDGTSVLSNHSTSRNIRILSVSPKSVSFVIPENGRYTVSVATLQGKSILNQDLFSSSNMLTINLPNLAAGQYVLRVQGKNIQSKEILNLY